MLANRVEINLYRYPSFCPRKSIQGLFFIKRSKEYTAQSFRESYKCIHRDVNSQIIEMIRFRITSEDQIDEIMEI
jgi:hypothetical protein